MARSLNMWASSAPQWFMLCCYAVNGYKSSHTLRTGSLGPHLAEAPARERHSGEEPHRPGPDHRHADALKEKGVHRNTGVQRGLVSNCSDQDPIQSLNNNLIRSCLPWLWWCPVLGLCKPRCSCAGLPAHIVSG